MEPLATVPRVRSVDETTYPQFAGFYCGGSAVYEREVDDLIAAACCGKMGPIEDACVAEDPDSGLLLGFCLIQRRVLKDPDDAYIALIAVSAACRGRRLPDGTRLGGLLLGDALMRIKRLWGGPPMPPVWAIISPGNIASHSLFADWGFELVDREGRGDDYRYRGRGLGVVPTKA
jgi:hypothetical protein